jgi:hypothetical protein
LLFSGLLAASSVWAGGSSWEGSGIFLTGGVVAFARVAVVPFTFVLRPHVEFMTKLEIHPVMTSGKPYNYMLCNVTSIRDLNGSVPGFSTLLAQ